MNNTNDGSMPNAIEQTKEQSNVGQERQEQWREKVPRTWSTKDHEDFVRDLGIDEIFFDFYNSAYLNDEGDKCFQGFRACSVDPSRSWAEEHGWLMHPCGHKEHRNMKHSVLSDKPIATWVCPETGKKSYSPHRYIQGKNFVQIYFDTRNEVIEYAHKPRVWYWELSLQHLVHRGQVILPKRGMNITDEMYSEQWNRVISHPYMLEVDASRMNNKKRRDLLSSDDYLEGAMYFINVINEYLEGRLGIPDDMYEWWFSGNGLYMIINPFYNSIYAKKKDVKIPDFFKTNLFFWDAEQEKLVKLTKDVKYVTIDNHSQYLRMYIKAPFSLHGNYDRLCLPLTTIWGDNHKIDLKSDLFKKLVYPKNLTKELINKYFRETDNKTGESINSFMRDEE